MSWTTIRRASIAALITTFMVTVASAQTMKSNASTSGTEQQVRAAQQNLLQAAIQGDKDAVGRLVADDVTWVGTNGQVMDKDQMLGMLPAPVHSIDVLQVVPEGKTAIVVGVAHLNNGPDTRFVQEWAYRDGQWKLDAHEGTRVASPQAGASTETTGTTGTTGMTGMAPSAAGTSGTSGTAGLGSTNAMPMPMLNSAAERAVWSVQQKLTEAFLKGDVGTYSKYTAPEYVRVTPEAVVGKTEFMRTVGENAGKSPGHLDQSDVRITVEGNTARVLLVSAGTLPGGQQTSPERLTRIFEKHSGQWQQVAAIFTPVAGQ